MLFINVQGAPSIATISEAPSPDRSTRGNSFESDNMANGEIIEKLFLVGVLDELRVCFSCSYEVLYFCTCISLIQNNRNFCTVCQQLDN